MRNSAITGADEVRPNPEGRLRISTWPKIGIRTTVGEFGKIALWGNFMPENFM